MSKELESCQPLKGLTVLDFSQFLAGPLASLRLRDLGATVIKVERPDSGDICRNLYVAQQKVDDESTIFHAINRDKDGVALDLKKESDFQKACELIKTADVMIQNFRPSVIKRLGLDFEAVQKINPTLIYGSVSGYGPEGPWERKPGQDLLAQSRSGISFLNGSGDAGPQPLGLSVADMMAAMHLVQGILAHLVRRGRTGEGGLIEVSLLDSMVDLQICELTHFMSDTAQYPRRVSSVGCNPYTAPPEGIYACSDGHIAIGRGSLEALCFELSMDMAKEPKAGPQWWDWSASLRSEIAKRVKTLSLSDLTIRLERAGLPACEVLDWTKMFKAEHVKQLGMVHKVQLGGGEMLPTTRSPIKIDGGTRLPLRGAPRVGEHQSKYL